MNFLLIQHCTIHIFFLSCVFSNELYSSVSKIEELLKYETDLVPLLENYLQTESSRLEEIHNRLNDFDHIPDSQSKFDEYISHPINQFNLIKQMAYHQWEAIEELVKSDNSIELLDYLNKNNWDFPDANDLEGSARALLRLQRTYKLDTGALASGIIKDFKASHSLTAEECYYIATVAFEARDFHHCELWMSHVLTFNINDTMTFSEFEVLDYLTHCSSETGDFKVALQSTRKMLEIEPGNDYAKNMYLDLLRISERNDSEGNNKEHNFIHKEYERLCRSQPELPIKVQRKMKCYYWTNNNQARLLFSPVKLEELYPSPHIVRFYDIISDEEIKVLQNISKPKLHRSMVVSRQTLTTKSVNSRVSQTAILADFDDAVVKRISQRIEDVTGLAMDTAEMLMVVNYGVGGQYEPHADYQFENEEFGYMNGVGNRIATFLFYLTDVAYGGATVFMTPEISVQPIKGSAVLWYNLYPSGEVDKRTRHAACPVLIGNKWIANKWIHERGQEFGRRCTLDRNSYHGVF